MSNYSSKPAPIGIFDSGYGGLTILNDIRKTLPEYDFIYLGDNARTPYGTRSFDVVYEYTSQAVKQLFDMGCHLVIIACNTASAKALRSIQQKDLDALDPTRRVLGVIRPTVEQIGSITQTKHIGLLGTVGTIQSESYPMELKKLDADIVLVGEACPLWVPLIENNEHQTEGADFFVKKNLNSLLTKDTAIDTIILGCTHYPLLIGKIKQSIPANINVVSQGPLVAKALAEYLQRHSALDDKCTKNASVAYFTTESEEKFKASASIFLQEEIEVKRISLK